MAVEFKFKSDHGYSTHDLGGAGSITIAQLKQVPAPPRPRRPVPPAFAALNRALTPPPHLFQAITVAKSVPAAFGLILTNAQTGEGAPPPPPSCTASGAWLASGPPFPPCKGAALSSPPPPFFLTQSTPTTRQRWRRGRD